MATFLTSNAVGEREDLSDVIYRIDPDETPVFSNAQKEIKKIFYNYNVLPNSGDVILSDNDYWFSVVHRNFSDDGHLGLLVTLDKNTNL